MLTKAAKAAAKTAKKRGPRQMSSAHKTALAEGREQGAAIRRYLDALEANRPKRGRKRTPESIEKRLGVIAERLEIADSLTRVLLIQEQMDLEREREAMQDGGADLTQLEKGSVTAVKPYRERKGIAYLPW